MRILLVDDDTAVIQALLAVLRSLPGHDVRVATSAEKAVENAAALGGLDLLITDVVMEPTDGFSLRNHLTAQYPRLRTILISGYDLSDYAEHVQGSRMLAKPIDAEELIGAVTEELAALQPVPVARPSQAGPATIKVSPSGKGVPVAARAGAAPSSPVRTVKAIPIPQPTAGPRAVVQQAPPSEPEIPVAVATPSEEVEQSDEFVALDPGDTGELAGQAFGAYQLGRKIANGRWGSVYSGVQVSINRPVAIEILDADKAADDGLRDRFIADARAKAQVQHPSIVAVYEAGEADGHYFYAHEFVDSGTLAAIKATGERLDEITALKVLRVAAEGLAYLTSHRIPHNAPDASSIAIGSDGQPHLANLAAHQADEELTPDQEIQAVGRVMLGALPPIQSLSQGLRDLIKSMLQTGPAALTSWAAVLQGIKAIEPKVIPVEAAKISAHDRAAIAAVELARKQQKRALYFSILSVVSLLALIGGLVWWMFRSNERNLGEQVDIPAGEFLFANGEPKTVPEFWIDKYEVTYGEYAKFVHALDEHQSSDYDDPHQPHTKTWAMHKPPHWDIYYPCAVAGKPVHQTPIDLNCPVMEVDYWDAYAYAKWKGRELPTEEEWEKAARGLKGFKYPWGEEFDPKKVNSGADFEPNKPSAKGTIDGFNFWNPVDKIAGDKSPFGVVGMAGNVREWTQSWDKAKQKVVVKGGSFKSKDVSLDQHAEFAPDYVDESVGFRTVSHTPPVKK
ncbi:MAG TPA: SUMF1/EgtB/PvdO family nonheme iron enzyme [Chthoniobacter sp.]|jgi:formylglycine-generating enzyme required for sulfatase activity/CheY-like chemotaxis protein